MKKPLLLTPYAALWRLARPLLRRHKRLAEGFSQRLVPAKWPHDNADGINNPVSPLPCRLWLHAASGGEAYLAREIVRELAARLEKKQEKIGILCTSMTRQGLEVLARTQQEFGSQNCSVTVNYMPLDEPKLMLKAVRQAFGLENYGSFPAGKGGGSAACAVEARYATQARGLEAGSFKAERSYFGAGAGGGSNADVAGTEARACKSASCEAVAFAAGAESAANAAASATAKDFTAGALNFSNKRAQEPCALVLLETEIWPGLLWAARAAGLKPYIINGRMTPGSFKSYQRITGTLHRLAPDHILASSSDDAARFKAVFDLAGKPSRVSQISNIKFDRVAPVGGDYESPLRPLLGELPPQLLLFASVREEEEEELGAVISALRQKAPHLCIIVAPRHLHRAEAWAERLSGMLCPNYPQAAAGSALKRAVQTSPVGLPNSCCATSAERRPEISSDQQQNLSAISEGATSAAVLKRRSQGVSSLEAGDVVLWDSFGDLMSLYGIADSTFVGGSLAPLGGQNFLEPLSFGIRPVIGPSWSNFYWVGQDIFKRGLVRQVKNAAELPAALLAELQNKRPKEQLKSSFALYLKQHQGGTAQAVDFLLQVLGL